MNKLNCQHNDHKQYCIENENNEHRSMVTLFERYILSLLWMVIITQPLSNYVLSETLTIFYTKIIYMVKLGCGAFDSVRKVYL